MGTRRQPCVRLIIVAAAISTLICAVTPVLVLGLVQVFTFDNRQYAGLVLDLLQTRPYMLMLPGLLGTVVWVGTLIDVFKRRRGDLRSAVPLLVAIVLLNILAVTYYWVRELQSAWGQRARERAQT